MKNIRKNEPGVIIEKFTKIQISAQIAREIQRIPRIEEQKEVTSTQ